MTPSVPSANRSPASRTGVVRLARVITEVLAPWAVIVFLAAAVALQAL